MPRVCYQHRRINFSQVSQDSECLSAAMEVASPICASWNQMAGWLRAVEGLRRAA